MQVRLIKLNGLRPEPFCCLEVSSRIVEVGDAVIFLASDASSYITAQTINVNGGLYF